MKKSTSRAVIVQCRLSSTRLPEKALKLLGGKTVLSWVLKSMKKVPADRYFVATDEASYDSIQNICKENGFECFAGDLNNVLKRFCDLIKIIDCDTVIRATADNPFLFYDAAAESADLFEKLNASGEKCDYLTYSGLPHGSGVEIFSGKSLLKAAELTDLPYDKEHVGPALYNHPENFVCRFEKAPEKYNYPHLRTTIDTYSDFLRCTMAVKIISGGKCNYTTEEILSVMNNPELQNPVVYAPCVKKGHGTGHLHRCLNAALNSNSFVYIPENHDLAECNEVLNSYFDQGLLKSQVINQLPDETYACVLVSDSFKMDESQVNDFTKQKTLISIDEGSDFAQSSDFLIDIIPSTDYNRQPNLKDSSFILKPKNIKNQKPDILKEILICIGGEDPARIGPSICRILSEIMPESKISVISTNAALYGENKSARILSPVKNLKEQLYKYDLVVTHYGLTAFEASACGCAVLMVSTTELHQKLAEDFNFAYIPFGQVTKENVIKALKSNNIFPESIINAEQKYLQKKIQELATGSRLACPVCQENNATSYDKIISRNETRTYRKCHKCGMIYISWTAYSDKKYEKAYFFEDYKKQYGKTYQEDFESIKKQCFRRVDEISSIIDFNKQNKVLDIGCAYGPFLSAAQERNFSVFGTDISDDAVDYVKNTLHYKACVSIFPDFDSKSAFEVEKFDIVTMWYVIEHFKNLDTVLKKVSQLVEKNGIFAFSTPSGEGVSAVTDKNHFYQISPTDHYSVWEPSNAARILEKYGFEVVKTVSTGHHPERFPQIKESKSGPESDLWKQIDKLSHEKNLGDTVEIYCRKI